MDKEDYISLSGLGANPSALDVTLHELSGGNPPCCSCHHVVYLSDASTYRYYHACNDHNHQDLRFNTVSYGNMDGRSARPCRCLCMVTTLAVIFMLLSVILVGYFFGHYKGGLNWDEHNFNFHPFLTILGFICIYGHSMLTFKVLQGLNKLFVKILHAILNLLALIFIAIGINCAFKVGRSHLYSMHSWCGFIALLLFVLQWLFGFITFLFPQLSQSAKSLYKPLHVFWGVVVMCLASAAVLTGIMEETGGIADYQDHGPEGLLINFMGLCVVASAIAVSYIATNPEFTRQPDLDEEHIPIN